MSYIFLHMNNFYIHIINMQMQDQLLHNALCQLKSC